MPKSLSNVFLVAELLKSAGGLLPLFIWRYKVLALCTCSNMKTDGVSTIKLSKA
jgi:hypothetical protein